MKIEQIVTSGRFELDGGTWDVDNNVWLIGDDDEVLVVDAAHDPAAIAAAVGDRRLVGVFCTHAHNDHINAVADLVRAFAGHVQVWLHPADDELWRQVYDGSWYEAVDDGDALHVAGLELEVLHTPGHTPGGCGLYLPELRTVFTGDTLFQGGPGATGRRFSDFPTIIESIRGRLLTLPEETVVHTGHGPDTTIGAEAPHLEEWVARGH